MYTFFCEFERNEEVTCMFRGLSDYICAIIEVVLALYIFFMLGLFDDI